MSLLEAIIIRPNSDLRNADLNEAKLHSTTLAGMNHSTTGLTEVVWNLTISPMNNETQPCTPEQLIPLA